MRRVIALGTCLIVAGCFTQLQPRSRYGRITGRVLDASASVVQGVGVSVINTDTGVAFKSTTNAKGKFEFPDLISGPYRFTAGQVGFKQYQRGPIQLHVGDVLEIEARLAVGGPDEIVIVDAAEPVLQSSSASVGRIIDGRRITELPLPAANVMYLTQLPAGVVQPTSPDYEWVPYAVGPTSANVVAGAGDRRSEFTIDGAPNNYGAGTIALSPPPEMVQEFRVETASFDAGAGHFAGGQVNLVLKSGTNAFHGSATYSNISRALMTRHFFTNRYIFDTRTGPITPEKIAAAFPAGKLSRDRLVLGGPLYVPLLYDGRRRTFWTYGYDRLDRYRSEQNFFTVPTRKERNGDFSDLLALGAKYQIYDPATIAPGPGGRFSRKPFAGNIIPQSRLDAMAGRLLNYWPLPNTPGTPDGTNNYFDPRPRTVAYRSHLLRIDHIVGDRHRINISFSRNSNREEYQDEFHNAATGIVSATRHSSFTLDDVFVLRPNAVIDLRYGFARLVGRGGPKTTGVDLAALGFSDTLVRLLDPKLTAFPDITFEGYSGTDHGVPSSIATTQHFAAGTISTVQGNHSVRFGGELRAIQKNSHSYGDYSPGLNFGSDWTRGPFDNSTRAPIGQGMASFLLGLPTDGGITINDSSALLDRYLGFFVQDDWKLTPRLTVNAGLRYELLIPRTERFNRMNRGFDFTTPSPVQDEAAASYARNPIPELPAGEFKVRGGLLFAGTNGLPSGAWNMQKTVFAPRFGLAYRVGSSAVVRAGYGIFPLVLSGEIGTQQYDTQQQGFNRATRLVPSLDNGLTFSVSLANPFPNGVLRPSGATLGLRTFLGQSIWFTDPDQRWGYMQRWTLNLQREIRHRVLLEIGYVGNRGTGLSSSRPFNEVPAGYLSTSRVRDQATVDYLSAQVANPFSGMADFAGTGVAGRTTSRGHLLSPYPQFAGISSYSSDGNSWYHALLASIDKRFSGGHTLGLNYTWSKFMEATDRLNATDPVPSHTISGLDRTHRLVFDGIYEFPIGRGRPWLDEIPVWLDFIVGGWSLQGIYQYQSGGPLGWGNVLFYGDISSIALPADQRTPERYFDTSAFETEPRKQLSYNVRTFPLRLSGIRSRPFNNVDISLTKETALRRRVRLQVRAEAQNLCNRAEFSGPNSNPTSALFGQLTAAGATATEQRRVMLTGKLIW